jgi:LPXTG-motif cell wall-anchored protein
VLVRTARTVAAAIGAVTIGALLWATPTQAAPITPPDGSYGGGAQGNVGQQHGGKVRVTVTAGNCGTRSARTITMRIVVPAQGVGTGPYTAVATVGHREVGRVQSHGTTPRTKRITLAEDSYNGLARVRVAVVGGRPSMRPAPSVTRVDTDCRPAARPRVTSTGPTCRSRNMVVTVTNPNVLPKDKVRVRIGMTRPKTLRAGQSTSLTVRNGVWVWAGNPLRRLKYVSYVLPGCGVAAASPAAVPAGTMPPVQQISSGGGDSSSNDSSNDSSSSKSSNNGDSGNNGGLPVTGAGVAGITVAGILMLVAGLVGLMFVRKRRTSFTA